MISWACETRGEEIEVVLVDASFLRSDGASVGGAVAAACEASPTDTSESRSRFESPGGEELAVDRGETLAA